ncbi:MAG TPA: sn-glycerol-3-phosphate ABC transporter ATP-binding protein UgpC [Thermomicrobiales bacterium]|nr:sn-glycerol-3-phosphate ABC transporter ATP-binding protein UgpC [Thermomicrobiales bacterium]
MAQVIFDHVNKVFDNFVAVNDLNLEIRDGEFLVLVGPSGCGKSTALRCLAGLEEITSGTIHIGDRDVTYLDPKDRDIAMVFQNYALYPHMSVRDNMAFGLKLRKTPKDEIDRRVNQAAEILGITALLDRKPRALSGGQRQRVALGRAIVREPQCFLMDEPLSNLDAKLRVQTRAEIINLQKRLGTTTIYVTHDQVEAMTMGDRIAVMNEGRLQQLDTPQNLYDFPQNRFVATFIGSPAMNVFSATVSNGTDRITLDAGSFTIAVPASRSGRLMGRVGQDVMIGVRPEHIQVTQFAEDVREDNSIGLPVELVEPLGSETLLHLKGPKDSIVAKVDPRTNVRAGEVAELTINLDHLHAFDPVTEEVLS